MKGKLLLILGILTCSTIYSQTESERLEITKNYDKQKLSELSQRLSSEWNLKYKEALRYANDHDLEISYTKDGKYYSISHINQEGHLVYLQTDGIKADKNARVDHISQGGSLGLNLQGQGMTAYIWDGGTALPTHEGYKDSSNNSRYERIQGALGSHASHVTGIIICNDTDPNAKGIAPEAKGKGYEFGNDVAEATNEAANGMLVSNHSYGNTNSALADATFGQYNHSSRDWDELLFLAPYYTMVTSAGNDGNDDSSNARPLDNNAAFDKLSGAKCAKNTIVVANSHNATIDANGNLVSVTKSPGSSEGPTDDYRIKPDIAAFGHGVYSTNAAATNHYSIKYGTSMACPSVSGTILLLQQHGNNVNGKFFKSATVKGLTLHTADDFADIGPDANTGWGLINAKRAVQTITGNGNTSKVLELTINQGQTISLNVKSDAVNDLISSISWTDPEGATKTSTNNHTAILVNDLDIKVTKNTETHLPWRLNSVNTSSKGDNKVDPFERVDVSGATGTYTITITHKGTLKYGKQDFSLIVTGLDQTFNITNSNTNLNFCKNTTAPKFDFNFTQTGTTPVQLSTTNLPSGVTSTLSTSSISSNGTFNVTLNNTDNLIPGAHSFYVSATNGSDTYTTPVSFYIYNADFSNTPIVLNEPSNGSNSENITTTLKWAENTNAVEYKYYISKNAKFTSLVKSGSTRNHSIKINNLVPKQVYYWKVEPKNSCTTLTNVPVFSFQVGQEDCNNSYTNNTSVPINNTQDNSGFGLGNGFSLSAKPISDEYVITKATIDIDISHTNTAELNLVLNNNYGADSPDNRVVQLSIYNCANGNDIKATYSDQGSALVCSSSAPAISGTIKPTKPLSSLIGLDTKSYWYIYTVDNTNGNNGTINSFTLNFCVTKPLTSTLGLDNKTVEITPNSTSAINNTHLKTNTTDNTIYTITALPTKGNIIKNGSTVMAIGDTFTQNDIDNNQISFSNTETSNTTDQFKVDVLNNNTKEWLANETVAVNIVGALSVGKYNDTVSNMFPNPTTGNFTIVLKKALVKDGLIKVLDIQGRIVYSQQIKQGEQIININPSNQFNSGLYLVNLTVNNNTVTQKLIVK